MNGLEKAAAHTWRGMFEGEPILGKTYRADGWFYVDPPGKFKSEDFDNLLARIGNEGEHYVFLVKSTGPSEDGTTWKRGQLLVSPQGIANFTSSIRKN